MKLTIDFETRSEAPLKQCGAHIYANHPSTEVMCLAVKVDDEPTRIWIPEYFVNKIPIRMLQQHYGIGHTLLAKRELSSLIIGQAETIEAHNVFFERCIYNFCLSNYSGNWPVVPVEKWRCSAAKAASYALPRSLDGACTALGLPITKDKQGSFIMHKLCKPRKPTKNNPAKWHEKPEDLLALFKYCIQDVDAEHGLSKALRDLSQRELKIWQVDQEINTRGIHVDVKAAAATIKLIEKHKKNINKEFKKITGLSSPTQVAKTLKWLANKNFKLKDLTKASVEKALKRNPPPDVRRVLEIRQVIGKSSTAKFKAMIKGADEVDDRMRDTLLYHGAATGRWAGRRIQLHNMPRKMPDDFENIIEAVSSGGLDSEDFKLLYGDPMQILSGCIRGYICAATGKKYMCADYSSIEGRGLAWVAEEDYILQNYFDGKDAYCIFASQIHGVPYQTILDGHIAGIKKYSDMRFEGKTGELACGYQGGEAAIARFAPDMPMRRRRQIVKLWRENRPRSKAFWKETEELALSAVATGLTYTHPNNLIRWGMKGSFLHCCLPSGRLLSYYSPSITETTLYAYEVHEVEDKDGEKIVHTFTTWDKRPNLKFKRLPDKDFTKPSLQFWGVDSETGKWRKQQTYGGKLTENIVQAIARDILAEALVRLEANSYPVVMHVHDEAIAEVDKNVGNVKEFCDIMCQVPKWATGFPIAAEGFETIRYRKG
jgi:DNA polymerase